jgi:hypothetical protein
LNAKISADNSVGFNNEAGHVRDFQLYAAGNGDWVLNLKARRSVFGAMYAPNVDITPYPSVEMRGAIVGGNVTFKSGCTFYYGEALRNNVIACDEGGPFVVRRWQEE